MVDPHVKILRKFRDRFLRDNGTGKTFVSLYNTYSPPMADFIAKHDNVGEMVHFNPITNYRRELALSQARSRNNDATYFLASGFDKYHCSIYIFRKIPLRDFKNC